MKPRDLLDNHPDVWQKATRHPFLDGVREGALSTGAFDSWLKQDYVFVSDLLVFQARLLARSPRPHQAVLAGGLVAVEAELGWFEDKARERGLELAAHRLPATAAYRDFMFGMENEPYPAAITALWALELAYLEAWRGAAPGHSEYREFVEHWTTREFADYVAGLEEAAGASLESADGKELQRAESTFLEVCRLERDFWEMALQVGNE
ncbi:thiaminase II [soil metagenome]